MVFTKEWFLQKNIKEIAFLDYVLGVAICIDFVLFVGAYRIEVQPSGAISYSSVC